MKTQKRTTIALLIMLMVWLSFGVITGATMIRFSENNSDVYLQEEEMALEIEDWMTNDFIWDAGFRLLKATTEELDDEALDIAAWMTDDSLWRF